MQVSHKAERSSAPPTESEDTDHDWARTLSALSSYYSENQYLEDFNARLLKFQMFQLLFSVALVLICLVCIGIVLSRPVKNNYFLLNQNGQLIGSVSPNTDPIKSSQSVRKLVDDCVHAIFDIDFVHYKSQLSDAERCFTRDGFIQILSLMQERGLLKELSKGYRVGAVIPREANFIRSATSTYRGFRWKVKGEYLWSLKQGTSTIQYPLSIEVSVIKVASEQSPLGIAIDSMTVKRI